MLRYLRLLALQLRISFTVGAQYRVDFLLDALLSVASIAFGLLPLQIAVRAHPLVGGWDYPSALLVVGWFTGLKALLDGTINPSLSTVVEHIRKGTLDFLLIKPVDAQFLVSTSKFDIWKGLDVLVALGIIGWSFHLLGRVPRCADVAVALTLLVSSVAVIYALWILVVAAAFWVVRLDNLSYLLNSIFDFARWPISVFRGVYRLIFTYVIPLALMTTFPAQALLGRIAPTTAVAAIVGSLAFVTASRLVWTRALGHYTSASS